LERQYIPQAQIRSDNNDDDDDDNNDDDDDNNDDNEEDDDDNDDDDNNDDNNDEDNDDDFKVLYNYIYRVKYISTWKNVYKLLNFSSKYLNICLCVLIYKYTCIYTHLYAYINI
jgi:hypothetical protein